jgi:hypothetical protein
LFVSLLKSEYTHNWIFQSKRCLHRYWIYNKWAIKYFTLKVVCIVIEDKKTIYSIFQSKICLQNGKRDKRHEIKYFNKSCLYRDWTDKRKDLNMSIKKLFRS